MTENFPLPIDSEVDLSIFEDKTLGDLEFKNNLVNKNTYLLNYYYY